MICIDGKIFATLELATPFFKAAVKIEIYNEPGIKSLPALPDGLEYLYANSATTLPALPDGLKTLYADSATSLPALPDGLEYLSADSAKKD